jgi:glc operon protein GlcG
MRQKFALTLDDVRRVAAAAHKTAQENHWNVVIAIVDEGGQLMYLERMDEVQSGSVNVSIEKARTAIAFRRPSQALEAAVSGGRTVMLKLPGATPIEGGVPLVYEGNFVGAIGVSGVQSSQDGIIAKAGADAL